MGRQATKENGGFVLDLCRGPLSIAFVEAGREERGDWRGVPPTKAGDKDWLNG